MILRKFILSLYLLAAGFVAFSQSRVIINNNAYIRMNGGTSATPVFMVVQNGNANAITTAGSGGNFVSESEWNILRWHIGTNTGTFTIPYTSNPATTNFKFPFTMQITAGGVGAGIFDFSTYETATDMNVPWASIVTHMTDADNVPADNSLNVVDRFWIMNTTGYTTKPDVNMTFGYVDHANELYGTNTISEASLVAQRWNSSTNQWEGNNLNTAICYGIANTTANHVTNVDIPPSELFEVWVLVNNTSLLPVELTSFNATCVGNGVEINWTTASENGSDKFEIERSWNGILFEYIGEVNAVQNSNQNTDYSFTDPMQGGNIRYYRIKQIDQNGNFSYFPIIAIGNCNTFSDDIHVFSDNDNILIHFDAKDETPLIIDVYSADGKWVQHESLYPVSGFNSFILKTNLSSGIYLVSAENGSEKTTTKIFIK